MIQPMFDNVFVQGQRGALWWVGIGILVIFCVRAVSSAGQKILMTKVNQLSSAGMRSHLLRHLMTLDGGYHQVNPPGQLIERVQSDVTVVNQIWTALFTGIGRDLIAVIVLFSVALSVDWRWTALALWAFRFLCCRRFWPKPTCVNVLAMHAI